MSIGRFSLNHKMKRTNLIVIALCCALLLTAVGATLASGNWRQLWTVAASRTNPSAVLPAAVSNPAPLQTAEPRLAKEYIYAGGRMLAIEEPGAPPTAATVYVRGRVFNQNRRGAIGVQITMTDSSGQSITTTTNINGFFQFTNIEIGTYSFAPAKNGCTFNPSSIVRDVNDNITDLIFRGICN
jgi:hypothetical protein